MNDTEFKLYRALYFYQKTRDGKSYDDVVNALNLCIAEDCNGWLAASVSGEEGHEMVRPGIISDDDGNAYYIMCPNEEDMSQMEDEGLTKLHVRLRGVIASISNETKIAGICLNPWDGGCFVPRGKIK